MHEVIDGAYVEGSVVINDKNLYGPGVDPVAVRRKIGMVFQRPNPEPRVSVQRTQAVGTTASVTFSFRRPQPGFELGVCGTRVIGSGVIVSPTL
jgi:ABC-type phosphate transport system ATPase subunit